MIRRSRAVMGVMLVPFLILGACASPGEESRPDVYDQSQVNSLQQARVVQIVSVSRARVNVDNTKNHKKSRMWGSLLGGALGAGLATGVGHVGWGAGLASGLGGLAAGALLGGEATDTQKIIRGVMITYQNREGGALFMSTQIGRPCEYKPGNALLVTTAAQETRIQPNASCKRK